MLINGRKQDTVPAIDRGLQYGDGLFETIAVVEGYPCLWQRHMQRLSAGCDRLCIPVPDSKLLYDEVLEEIAGRAQGVIRITLTRGPGERGYSLPPVVHSTRIVQWSEGRPPMPGAAVDSIVARICRTRLGINPALAGLKHLNRLEQVMARSEWSDPSIQEGVMCDSDGYVIECTSSNLFLLWRGHLLTPNLKNCGVAGIMRGLVMDTAKGLGMKVSVSDITLEQVMGADALFVTNSLTGIRPVRMLETQAFAYDAIPAELVDSVMSQGFSHE
ncbi:MAG: aminodeoxychorismate lyase [Sedimenticola sp.]|nr:aminodeoxychorismate lyase [Sedimenticola sp.]